MFGFLKKTPKRNSIHNMETKLFSNDTGEFPAIVIGLNVYDGETAEAFFDDVIEQFKLHRMASPPETANLTVTLAGVISALEFCNHWFARCEADPILDHFTSIMVHADVLHISGSELLDRASLVR